MNYEYSGWSECKLTWEERSCTLHIWCYDSLFIKYIGPLPQHKVDIVLGEQDANGSNFTASVLESVGSIKANYAATYSSGAWKTATLALPAASANSNRAMLDELRFLIHDTTGGTALTSPPGIFCFDLIGLEQSQPPCAGSRSTGACPAGKRLRRPGFTGGFKLEQRLRRAVRLECSFRRARISAARFSARPG